MDNPKKVIVRFPPSPTGSLHIGGARTALFNYLFAKKYEGKIYLRLEDTDRERSKKEYEDSILSSLSWLGLSMDTPKGLKEGELWRQSERGVVYQSHLKRLIDEGKAYVSKEDVKKEAGGEGKDRRDEVIRFKNPGTIITFDDVVRGPITFDTKELGDFVIAKSPTEPLYHLAVVIDDAEMEVTHVIRGEDHISNTPRQILLLRALGFSEPIYAHIPLILAPDRSKLSKRHGAVSVTEYRDIGFLPEALINYLALLGWNPGGEQEIFSLTELVKQFDLGRVQKGGAIFNEEKLRSINRHYLKEAPSVKTSTEEKIRNTFPNCDQEIVSAVIPIIIERISTLSEIDALIKNGEFSYFFQSPQYEKNLLFWKGARDANVTSNRLTKILELIENISDFSKEGVKTAIYPYAEKEGKGDVLWPFRIALSGQEKSTDPFTIASIIGKKETLERVRTAKKLLEQV